MSSSIKDNLFNQLEIAKILTEIPLQDSPDEQLLRPNLIGVTADTPVYRVLPVSYFICNVENQDNFLRRPHLWEDPFENALSRIPWFSRGIPVNTSHLLNCWYGQCWSLKEQETDALWRIYSPNKDGVRVKSTVGKLVNSLLDAPRCLTPALQAFAVKVNYLPVEDIIAILSAPDAYLWMVGDTQGNDNASILSVKRTEFDHEEEMRILFRLINDVDPLEDTILYPADPNYLFEEALLHPQMSVIDVSRNISALVSAGYNNPVSQSELYQLPTTLRIDVP
jgi:hypothetical protein